MNACIQLLLISGNQLAYWRWKQPVHMYTPALVINVLETLILFPVPLSHPRRLSRRRRRQLQRPLLESPQSLQRKFPSLNPGRRRNLLQRWPRPTVPRRWRHRKFLAASSPPAPCFFVCLTFPSGSYVQGGERRLLPLRFHVAVCLNWAVHGVSLVCVYHHRKFKHTMEYTCDRSSRVTLFKLYTILSYHY